MARKNQTADTWDENSTRNENKENLLCMNGRRLLPVWPAHAYIGQEENSKRTQKFVESWMCERIEENRHSIEQIIFINSKWTDSILPLFICGMFISNRIMCWAVVYPSSVVYVAVVGQCVCYDGHPYNRRTLCASWTKSVLHIEGYSCCVNRYFGDSP